MSRSGTWHLAPAYDVTFCEGPGGYHQMDVMGEALEVTRGGMLRLAEEAEVPAKSAADIITRMCESASQFAALAQSLFPQMITEDTLQRIQQRINENVRLLR